MDDAALVQQAVAGSRDAFAAIYDRYAGRAHDFLWWSIGDRDEAADIVQDTFLTAGARLHQLRDPSKLRPWLFAIARHQAFKSRRRGRRWQPLGDIELADHAPGADEAVARVSTRQELADLIGAAAEGLGPRDRMVLDLHLRQGLEGAEPGEALGVSTEQAYVLMSRLRDQVERALGALFVARLGRRDCSELDDLLAEWDGQLTTIWRRRIARHADACEACAEVRHRRVSAAALLSVAPAYGLASSARDRVLAEADLCGHTGRSWKGPPEGFPPAEERQGGRRWPTVAAAAVLLLVAGAVALVSRDEGHSQNVAAGGATTVIVTSSTRPRSTSSSVPNTSSTTVASTTSPTNVVPSPTATRAPATTQPSGGGSAGGGPAGGGGGTSSTAPSSSTTSSTARSTTTTQPPDRAGPTVSITSIAPSVVKAGPQCANADPDRFTVTASVTDASGVARVTVQVAPGLPATPMASNGNGTYTATLGPIEGVPVDLEAAVIVQGTDRAGNVSAATGSVTLRCVRSARA